MRINHLLASGLKSGKTAIDHDLNKVTVFCGPNFAGKTARLDAIRLGLMGYLPELGKQPGATMGLSANGTIGVTLELEGMKTTTRTWTRNAKGAIKAIQSGDTLDVPAVLMDPNEYFSLGDKDRVRYVFGLTKIEAPNETVNSIVSKTKALKFEAGTPHHEAVIAELVETIMESDRQRYDEEQPVQDWIEGLITAYQDSVRVTKQNADRMVKTVQGITQIKSVEDDGVLRDCEAKIAVEEAEITRLTELRATLMGEAEKLRRDHQTKGAIEARLATAGDRTAEVAKLRNSIAAEEARLTALQSQGPADPVPSEAVAKLEAELAGHEKTLRELEAQESAPDLPAARPDSKTEALKESVHSSEMELCEIETQLKEACGCLTIEKREQIKDAELKECPFCSHKGTGWRSAIEKRHVAEIKRLEKDMPRLEKNVGDKVSAITRLRGELKNEIKLDEQHTAAITQQAEASRERRNRIASQRGTVDGTRVVLGRQQEADRRAHAAKVQEHNQAVLAQSHTLKVKRAELDAIEESQKAAAADRTRLADLTGPDYVRLTADKAEAANGVENEWQSAVARRSLLQARQRAFSADQQDAKRQAQARLAADEAMARVEVLAALVKMLEALQVAMVEEAFKPLIAAANQMTHGILPSDLAYHAGELGRWAGSTWVSHNTFSGTEKALAYAGLSVALAKDSPIKIVLLDEMGRLTADNKNAIVERMLELIGQGVIDQAVMVDVTALQYKSAFDAVEGVSIVQV